MTDKFLHGRTAWITGGATGTTLTASSSILGGSGGSWAASVIRCSQSVGRSKYASAATSIGAVDCAVCA